MYFIFYYTLAFFSFNQLPAEMYRRRAVYHNHTDVHSAFLHLVFMGEKQSWQSDKVIVWHHHLV